MPSHNKPKGTWNDGREAALHSYVFSHPKVDQIRGNPTAVLAVMAEFIENQQRMMTFKDSKVDVVTSLEELQTRPKIIVELGTYVGYSAITWGKLLKEWHPGSEDCKVFGTELNAEIATIARDLVKLAGLADVVDIMTGLSADSLRQFASDGVRADMLFIDHWERYYLSDLRLCEDLGLLREGTVIVADNTDIPGAPDYLEHVQKGGSDRVRYTTKTYSTRSPVGTPDAVEVSTVVSVSA